MEAYVIAERYADALAQVLGPDKWDKGIDELNAVHVVLNEFAELQSFFASPIVARERKVQVLQRILACADFMPEVDSFFHILIEKDRITILAEIIRAFKALIQDSRNMETAFIRCAKQLGEEDIVKIVDKLSSLSERTLRAEVSHDPSLLCGLVAQVGHVIYDMSLRTKLDTLQTELLTKR